jgi:bacteriorhodopsin
MSEPNPITAPYENIEKLSKEEAELVTEFLKERIYATITLIALLATLWRAAEYLSPLNAALSVAGTVVALWLAIGIASRMSYQAVNGRRMNIRVYGQILRLHSALLVPAFPVLFLIGVSAIGIVSLETALFSSMIILLLSFAGFSLLAGRKMHSNFLEIIITSAFEVALGVGVIVLKVVAGH